MRGTLALPPGSRLGPYEIVAALGAGGMGEVYRARDTSLKRQVAIKVLPESLANDPDRLARFQREAEVLAALSHSNIAHIYGLEKSSGTLALVMELVEGPTLAEKIGSAVKAPGSGMPLEETLAIARQIADALEAAHEQGIIHRDLKPSNIKVRDDGAVKVLDFGLAKLADPLESNLDGTPGLSASPTMTSPAMTRSGIILGTAAYMSPEQARGISVDKRADIWAFGCVLFEMLTGRVAFAGDTVSDTIAAVLTREPEWRLLPSNTPPAIRRLLHRALERDRRRRLRDIADARADIDDALAPDDEGAATPSKRTRPSIRFWIAWTIVTLMIALLTGWFASRRQTAQPGSDAMAASVVERITSDAGLQITPALSPDGRLLAYASDRAGRGDLDIWVQQPRGAGLLRVTNDSADEYSPDFSPDGNQIVFRSEKDGGGVYIVPALGGAPQLIAKDGRSPRFSPDGSRVAYWTGQWRGARSGLASAVFVQPVAGGAAQQFLRDFYGAREPVWAPDGRSMLVLGRQSATGQLEQTFDYWWVPLDGRTPTRSGVLDLLDFRRAIDETSLSFPVTGQWTASGVLMSLRGSVWSIPVSQTTGRVSGAPRRLTIGAGEYYGATASGDGKQDQQVVFTAIENPRVIERAELDPHPDAAPAVRLYSDHQSGASRPSQTADGLRIVFTRKVGQQTEFWMRDTRTGQERLLARIDAPDGFNYSASPDGTRIAYTLGAEPEGTGYVAETAGGVAKPVCRNCELYGFMSDNKRVLAILDHGHAIGVIDSTSGAQMDAVRAPNSALTRAHPSPNDRWLAFRSTEGIVSKVFIVPLMPGHAALPGEWLRVDEPTTTGRPTGWSLDSQILYLLLDTDGFRCLWAQRVDAAGKPVGEPYPARHFHRTLTQEFSTSYGNAIGPDGFLYGGSAMTGDIWRLVLRNEPNK